MQPLRWLRAQDLRKDGPVTARLKAWRNAKALAYEQHRAIKTLGATFAPAALVLLASCNARDRAHFLVVSEHCSVYRGIFNFILMNAYIAFARVTDQLMLVRQVSSLLSFYTPAADSHITPYIYIDTLCHMGHGECSGINSLITLAADMLPEILGTNALEPTRTATASNREPDWGAACSKVTAALQVAFTIHPYGIAGEPRRHPVTIRLSDPSYSSRSTCACLSCQL